MIVVLQSQITKEELGQLVTQIEVKQGGVQVIQTKDQTILRVSGEVCESDIRELDRHSLVTQISNDSKPYVLAGRSLHPYDSVIDVAGVKVGGPHLACIAGPCAVESEEQVIAIAKKVQASGANMLRGGAFKPRSAPYSFQGLQSQGLDILVAAKKATGLPIVSELMSTDYLEEFVKKVDLIQIGARNMQNFDLLKKLGQVNKPILLKRGLSATYEEWLLAAEYIIAHGNPDVILCERGIRTFETYTRNTLDLQAIPVIQKLSHLPIIIDPSHAGGAWWLVDSMAKAAIAAGANGLMIEVHNDPKHALSDGEQSLKPETYDDVLQQIKSIVTIMGKEI